VARHAHRRFISWGGLGVYTKPVVPPNPQHRQLRGSTHTSPSQPRNASNSGNRMRNLEQNMTKPTCQIVECVGRSRGGILLSLGVPIAESCFVQNAVFGVPAMRAALNKVAALAKKEDRKAIKFGGKKFYLNVISKVKVGPIIKILEFTSNHYQSQYICPAMLLPSHMSSELVVTSSRDRSVQMAFQHPLGRIRCHFPELYNVL
jgi:hypothetical protein